MFGQMIKVARTIRPSTYEAIYDSNVHNQATFPENASIDPPADLNVSPSYEYLKFEWNRFYFFRI